MLMDDSERKEAEAAKARLAAIIESSNDAIVSKDLNSIITSWNAGAERLFGYSAEEAIGHPITMLFPPDRVDEEQQILMRIRAGERVEHFDTSAAARTGRWSTSR
jgi:PAS domain S-box-containing protein